MRKCGICAFPLAVLLLLTGCGGLKLAEECVCEVNTLADVTMTVDECSADGATFIIQNGSDTAISFGLDFGVQAEKTAFGTR